MDCRLKKPDYKYFTCEDSNIIINLERLAVTFLEVFHDGIIKYFTFPRSAP